jgi:hypothetical protein
MRLAFAAAAVTIVFVFSEPNLATAQTPSGGKSALAKAGEAMNPMNWSMPKWKAPSMNFLKSSEKPIVTKKQPSVFSTVSKKTASGWNKTKAALSPSNLFPASTNKPAPKKDSPGFFSSMFQQKPEPKPTSTVNDFLNLPRTGDQ